MKKILLTSTTCLLAITSFALSLKKFNKNDSKVKYSFSDEGMSFTTARAVQPSGKIQWNNIRFGMINFGGQRHQKLNKHFGMLTALDVKNVGIADNDGTSRYRYNGYYLGLSTGLKIGQLEGDHVVTLGGGLDWAFKSKFKKWTIGDKRDSKTKDREYFNDVKLNPWNPYVFVSYKFKKQYGVKVSYYTNNYFASSYTTQQVNALNFTLLMGGMPKVKVQKK